jgi:hypothetical protein
MRADVGWRWRVENYPQMIGFSTYKFLPVEAFDERCQTPPLNSGECAHFVSDFPGATMNFSDTITQKLHRFLFFHNLAATILCT